MVNLGQAMQAYSVPCWWVGWWLWRAGCISQDTYLLYNKNLNAIINLENTKEICWEDEKCISIEITLYEAGKKSLKAKAHKILLENAC